MSKLTNVKGRITYISSHAKQENLYAVYETTERRFWRELAKCNQEEFTKSGTEGKCIEARELIIALPESFVNYPKEKLLQLFTEHFHQNYGVECIAALHHNKRKTNYHIHLIFSERNLLKEQIVKVASRNMFYDEKGKHVRTKKEILDENGQIRQGCKIIAKGEVYEKQMFTIKDARFKREGFLDEVKRFYTDLINLYVQDETKKLKVFDRNGAYLPTKKIGRNNPKEKQIRADNVEREKWNQTVDRALITGVSEDDILKVKKLEIGEKVKQSIRMSGKHPELFAEIIRKAILLLELWISRMLKYKEQVLVEEVSEKYMEQKKAGKLNTNISGLDEKIPEKPKKTMLAEKYPKLKIIYEKLDQHNKAIFQKEKKVEKLEEELQTCKGFLKGRKRKELKGQIQQLQKQIELMKEKLPTIVKEAGYKNVKEFLKVYHTAEAEYSDYQKTADNWEKTYGNKKSKRSIRSRLDEKKQIVKERNKNRSHDHKEDRGER